MALTQKADPQFSQPVRQIVSMLIVLGLTAALAVLIFPTVQQVFMASPYLKIFIVFVFLIGIGACFWQVFTLIKAVSWIEGFAMDRPGHEFTPPPRLLAPLAAMLAGRTARRSLTSTSTRSVLETVATRIEEQRDLTRYIISLLIFLGLLGTFYGLATVVPAVVDTIRSLAPQEGQDAMAGFGRLMTGLEGQLGGMGTAFGSSLLGLSGSLVVGLLELFASNAQNRFYRELEEWLSSITRIGIAGVEPEEALTAANVLTVIGHTTEQIDILRQAVEAGSARTAETEARIAELLAVLSEPKPEPVPVDNALLARIADGQERVAGLLSVPRPEPVPVDNALLARIAEGQERVAGLLSVPRPEPVPVDNALLARIAAGQDRAADLLSVPRPEPVPVDNALLARIAAGQERMAELMAAPKAEPPAPVDNGLLLRIAQNQERMAELLAAGPRDAAPAVDNGLLARIASGQDRLVSILESRDPEAGGLDAETRLRLRSIDTQLLRILEDLAAGRQDLVTEIRQDIAGLAEALRLIARRQ